MLRALALRALALGALRSSPRCSGAPPASGRGSGVCVMSERLFGSLVTRPIPAASPLGPAACATVFLASFCLSSSSHLSRPAKTQCHRWSHCCRCHLTSSESPLWSRQPQGWLISWQHCIYPILKQCQAAPPGSTEKQAHPNYFLQGVSQEPQSTVLPPTLQCP